MTAGVYAIRSTTTGRVYVGSSVDIERRWRLHRGHLDRGNHPCAGLRQDCQQHGAGTFVFDVLEVTEDATDTLISAEQRWIDQYRPIAYNSEQPVWRTPVKEKRLPPSPSEDSHIVIRLERILGERRMSIADLARDTGVAYTSLFELYHGRAKRVDLKTLNSICRALEVTPGDILEYAPDQALQTEES